jgi:hypothetical protein
MDGRDAKRDVGQAAAVLAAKKRTASAAMVE